MNFEKSNYYYKYVKYKKKYLKLKNEIEGGGLGDKIKGKLSVFQSSTKVNDKVENEINKIDKHISKIKEYQSNFIKSISNIEKKKGFMKLPFDIYGEISSLFTYNTIIKNSLNEIKKIKQYLDNIPKNKLTPDNIKEIEENNNFYNNFIKTEYPKLLADFANVDKKYPEEVKKVAKKEKKDFYSKK